MGNPADGYTSLVKLVGETEFHALPARRPSPALRLLERLLAQGEPEPAVLAALQQLVEDDERQPLFLFAVRGERAGSFERGSGGTLFIDEVGELDLELQPRLLRVLETREVVRLGSDKPRRVDLPPYKR